MQPPRFSLRRQKAFLAPAGAHRLAPRLGVADYGFGQFDEVAKFQDAALPINQNSGWTKNRKM